MMDCKTSGGLFGGRRKSGALLSLALFFSLSSATVNAQKPPAPDKEMDRVQAMVTQAKKDEEQFSQSGGQRSDANNPNLKWSVALWQYREQHPGTPATIVATVESLRLLNRVNRFNELQAKTDALKPDDAAWHQVLYVLMTAAVRSKDYNYLINKTETLTQTAPDREIKAQARFTVGNAYWMSKDNDRARKAFRAVVNEYPGTEYAEEADGNLREIEFLNPGQAAPAFDRKTIAGDPISLAGLKGKVVVLKFWGTY